MISKHAILLSICVRIERCMLWLNNATRADCAKRVLPIQKQRKNFLGNLATKFQSLERNFKRCRIAGPFSISWNQTVVWLLIKQILRRGISTLFPDMVLRVFIVNKVLKLTQTHNFRCVRSETPFLWCQHAVEHFLASQTTQLRDWKFYGHAVSHAVRKFEKRATQLSTQLNNAKNWPRS